MRVKSNIEAGGVLKHGLDSSFCNFWEKNSGLTLPEEPKTLPKTHPSPEILTSVIKQIMH